MFSGTDRKESVTCGSRVCMVDDGTANRVTTPEHPFLFRSGAFDG